MIKLVLYTHNSISIALDTCLEHKVFESRKRHKVLGKLVYCLKKNRKGLKLIAGNKSNYFSKLGLEIYALLHAEYHKLSEKWGEEIDSLKLDTSPM